jgi:hypothetical protein
LWIQPDRIVELQNRGRVIVQIAFGCPAVIEGKGKIEDLDDRRGVVFDGPLVAPQSASERF